MVYQQLYCWQAHNDLRLCTDLLLYQHQAVDSSVLNIAVKGFSHHLWYLTLEMVPLSLFSCKLNEIEKLELADCLLALKPKEPTPFLNAKIVLGMVNQASQKNISTGYGKPSFPEKYWQLPYFGTLGYHYSLKQWSFLSGWRCSKLARPTSISITMLLSKLMPLMWYMAVCLLQQGLSNNIKISYKWWNKTEKLSKLAATNK